MEGNKRDNNVNGDGELHNKPAHAVPLASAHQRPTKTLTEQAHWLNGVG